MNPTKQPTSGRALTPAEKDAACMALDDGHDPSKVASEFRIRKSALLAMWAERELARRAS